MGSSVSMHVGYAVFGLGVLPYGELVAHLKKAQEAAEVCAMLTDC
jgi:hypothetical protein